MLRAQDMQQQQKTALSLFSLPKKDKKNKLRVKILMNKNNLSLYHTL
jgi:hypothetical protein